MTFDILYDQSYNICIWSYSITFSNDSEKEVMKTFHFNHKNKSSFFFLLTEKFLLIFLKISMYRISPTIVYDHQ